MFFQVFIAEKEGYILYSFEFLIIQVGKKIF